MSNVIDVFPEELEEIRELEMEAREEAEMKAELEKPEAPEPISAEVEKTQEEKDAELREVIDKFVEENKIAYVYDGQALDPAKLTICSRKYVIFNHDSGRYFTAGGNVVIYSKYDEAKAGLLTVSLITGKENLELVEYSQIANDILL